MAKDMSKVYSEMLTKELVAIRARHLAAYEDALVSTTCQQRYDAMRLQDLIHQINHELASRIADFGLKV